MHIYIERGKKPDQPNDPCQFCQLLSLPLGKPLWRSGKESVCNAGDTGSIPKSGRSFGGGNGNPLQCFCLENPMDKGAWRNIVHGDYKESDTTEHTHAHMIGVI